MPQPSNEPTVDEQIEDLLPRHNCQPGCDGFGTYPENDGEGNPEPAQCQWCFEVVMPMRDTIKQLLASEKRELLERLESKMNERRDTFPMWDGRDERQYAENIEAIEAEKAKL